MNRESNKSTRLAIIMRRQLDADLLGEYFSDSNSFTVGLATTCLLVAQAELRKRSASLVLVDANFTDRDGFETSRRLLSSGQAQRVLMIDEAYNPLRAKLSDDIGAAYCPRSIGIAKLLTIVQMLALDGLVPDRVNGLIDSGQHYRIDTPNSGSLTKREIEVWTLLSEGHTVRELAALLKLSPSTVDNHKWRLMKKLEVSRSSELLRLAIKQGLVIL